MSIRAGARSDLGLEGGCGNTNGGCIELHRRIQPEGPLRSIGTHGQGKSPTSSVNSVLQISHVRNGSILVRGVSCLHALAFPLLSSPFKGHSCRFKLQCCFLSTAAKLHLPQRRVCVRASFSIENRLEVRCRRGGGGGGGERNGGLTKAQHSSDLSRQKKHRSNGVARPQTSRGVKANELWR